MPQLMRPILGISLLLFLSLTLPAQTSPRQLTIDYINKASRASNGNPELGYRYLDTARQLIATHHLEKELVRTGFIEMSLLLRTGKLEEALAYADSMQRVVQTPENRHFVPRLLRLRARAMNQMGQTAACIVLLKEALDSAMVLQDTAMCSVIYSNLGNKYVQFGAHQKALTAYLKSLELKRAIGQTSRLGFVFQGIATIHFMEGANAESRKYARMAIQNFAANDLACVAVNPYGMICDGFLNGQQLDSARHYSLLTMEFAQKHQCRLGLALAHYYLGKCQMIEENWMSAKENLEIALQESDILGAEMHQSMLARLVELHLYMQESSKAKRYMEALRVLTKTIDSPQGYLALASTETIFHKQLKNFELALHHSELYLQFKDSILGSEKTRMLEELRILHDVEQMENAQAGLTKDLQLANLDNELQSQRLTLQRGYLFLITACLVLLVVVFVAIVKAIRNRSRKKEVHLSEQLRRAQINPHFFFNVLNSIQAQVNRNEDRQQIVQNLASFARLMRQTLESSFHDFVSIQDEVDRLQHYINLQHLRFRGCFEYQIENHCSEATSIPSQLIQPLVENAIEHGLKNKQEKGYLLIRFSQEDQSRVKVEVENSSPEKNSELQVPARREHKSRALGIIAQRLKLFGNSKQFYFELNQESQSTQAIIFCPYR
ncbi:MAG: histidine kinase [Salibacteraceae bacterium]